MKSISLKLNENLLKLLEAVSKETHIPKSSLIRKGIELVVEQHRDDIVSAELQDEINQMLKEDTVLLKRLAE